MPAEIHQFLCRTDNFGVLVHDPASGATATIDAPDAAPVLAALAHKGWTLTDILVTHRHGDHIDGIPELRQHFPKARVVIPEKEAAAIVPVTGAPDRFVHEGDVVTVGALKAVVIETPGHTLGHIVYHFADEALLFAGDTLFSLGCGRVFETSMQVMHDSLQRLAALPGTTQVYCGHEYTQANGHFAATVDPQNAALQDRLREVAELRAQNAFTLPTTMARECATNPFLRAKDAGVQQALGMTGADPADVFAQLRERKNKA